jgi:hypothetical protein
MYLVIYSLEEAVYREINLRYFITWESQLLQLMPWSTTDQ